MESKNASEIIRGLALCLRDNPNQFNYEVHVTLTGVSVSASAPGAIGLQATAIGGQSGDVTGANIQPQFGEASIAFAQSQADGAISEQLTLAVMLLGQIASQLDDETTDPDTLQTMLDRLSQLALPVIVSETVRLLLKSVGL
jgi:hypothetical protein